MMGRQDYQSVLTSNLTIKLNVTLLVVPALWNGFIELGLWRNIQVETKYKIVY